MSRIEQLAFVLAAASTFLATPTFAGAVTVPIDQVKIVTFDRPVSTVYAGNPAMAEVTVIDSKHVFVLGKAFGTTNFIALDAKGNLVSNDPLTINGHVASTVTLNRGSNQYTYACAATRCEAAPVPGDTELGHYKPVMNENTQRQDMGTKAANGGTSQ